MYNHDGDTFPQNMGMPWNFIGFGCFGAHPQMKREGFRMIEPSEMM